MILEIADIRIHAGREAEFEEALARGLALISTVEGARSYKVIKCVETPQRYQLQIWWETLEDHMVGFRQGPKFQEWRAIVGPFFAAPPVVEHFVPLLESA